MQGLVDQGLTIHSISNCKIFPKSVEMWKQIGFFAFAKVPPDLDMYSDNTCCMTIQWEILMNLKNWA